MLHTSTGSALELNPFQPADGNCEMAAEGQKIALKRCTNVHAYIRELSYSILVGCKQHRPHNLSLVIFIFASAPQEEHSTGTTTMEGESAGQPPARFPTWSPYYVEHLARTTPYTTAKCALHVDRKTRSFMLSQGLGEGAKLAKNFPLH